MKHTHKEKFFTTILTEFKSNYTINIRDITIKN